jgi:hypothetical protein
MISAPMLLIHKFCHEVEFIVAAYANKVGIAGHYFKNTLKVACDLALSRLET